MAINRREAMRIGLGGGLAFFASSALIRQPNANAELFFFKPAGGIDQTARLQSALDQAARTGVPMLLPEGIYATRRLTLRSGTHLLGVSGKTILRCRDRLGLFEASNAQDICIEGLTLDGGDLPADGESALLEANAVDRLRISDCRAFGFRGHGFVLRRSSGSITDCSIEGIGGTALLGEETGDLRISSSRFEDCGASAIRVNSIGDCHIDANVIKRAATGISLVQRGQTPARIERNEIRDLYFRKYGETQGTGICVDGNCALIGNSVEDVPGYGILLGPAPSLSGVRHNRISRAYIGIAHIGCPSPRALAGANFISETRASATQPLARLGIALS